jgi:hypothetical protein
MNFHAATSYHQRTLTVVALEMGRWERNSEPGGADETRCRANLLIPSCDADYR